MYKMTPHKKLKIICDTIGYKDYPFGVMYTGEHFTEQASLILIDVKTIIFTQDFMDKYSNYVINMGIIAPSYYKVFLIDLHKNLGNVVTFLFDLITTSELEKEIQEIIDSYDIMPNDMKEYKANLKGALLDYKDYFLKNKDGN